MLIALDTKDVSVHYSLTNMQRLAERIAGAGADLRGDW